MPTSIEIMNKIKDIKASMPHVVNEENRDEVNQKLGEINTYENMLSDILSDEAKMRDMVIPVVSEKPKSFMESVFGARESFKGVDKGFVKVVNEHIHLAEPKSTDPTLPASGIYKPQFAETLAQGNTDSAIEYFQRAAIDNKADEWKEGEDKKESSLTWAQAVANIETIAHWVPVSKMALNDYGQLESVIKNELAQGLTAAINKKCLVGTSVTGIKGVCNADNIQKFEKKVKGDTVNDIIRKMITLSYTGSGFYAPTHIAISPYLAEVLDLEKDKNGNYLFPMLAANGTRWGLTVVEDVNLGNASGKQGCVVYNNKAATLFTKLGTTIEVGTQADQFIKNQLTILAECQKALAIYNPSSFVYCDDVTKAVG